MKLKVSIYRGNKSMDNEDSPYLSQSQASLHERKGYFTE